MARRPHNPEQLQLLLEESQPRDGGVRVFQSAAAFAADAPKSKKYKRRDFSSVANREVTNVENMIRAAKLSGDPKTVWASATPEHLVALFAIFHREVYGVLPGELAGDWMAVVSSVKKLLKDELHDNPVIAVEYLQWAFARERKREQKRTAQGAGGWRMGWRWAFLKRELLTDYRVSLQRSTSAWRG